MAYDSFNSDECLKRLHQIAEEIPSGVREETLRSVLQTEYSHELLETTNSNIISAAKQFTDNFWRDFNIPEKFVHMKELEEKSGKDDAWRPVTGEADINPILANVLRERRNKIAEEIKAIEEQSAALRVHLKNCSEKLNAQVREMETFTQLKLKQK